MDEENRTNHDAGTGASGNSPISKGVGIVVVVILLLAAVIYFYSRGTEEPEAPTPDPVTPEEQVEELDEMEMFEEDLEELDFEDIDAELEGEIELEFEMQAE